MTKRAFFYIDGFNLYYGLKTKGWKRFYRLDVERLCRRILSYHMNHELTGIKYFTARIMGNIEKAKRQSTYLEAVETLDIVKTIDGVYHRHPITCKKCKKNYFCSCGYPYIKSEEKRTDVNIASNLQCDGFSNQFNTAFLISADSDLVPAIEKFKMSFPTKRIIVYFPPGRSSKDLQKHCHICRKIFRKTLEKSQFPDKLTNRHGYIIQRPLQWYWKRNRDCP